MFSLPRALVRLASAQAARWLALSGRPFAVAAIAIAVSSLSPTARADTIATFVSNTGFSAGQPQGQSVTTSAGGPWTNITFNFYDTSGAFASGNLYLLDQAYSGTPLGLSSLTTGYIGTGTASGGTSWVFNPGVFLQPNTQYFFYMDSAPGTLLQLNTANAYSGGNLYGAANAASNYSPSLNGDMNFTLEGTESAPGPIPGAGLLSYLFVGFGGLAAFRKKLRARAGALFAALKLRWPAVVLLNRGALKRA